MKSNQAKNKWKPSNPKKKKEKGNINQLETRFKMAINKHLSIITLNVDGLNAPIRRHRSGRLDTKAKTFNLLPTRNSPEGKGHI